MGVLVREGTSGEKGAILALIPDVFFAVTVRNAVRRLGYDPSIVKTADDLADEVTTADPVLAVVDVAGVTSDIDWDTIGALVLEGLPVLAFGAHKDVEGLRAAKAAGVTRVVSNGQFHREMSDLILRYATSPHAHPTDVEEIDDELTHGSLPPGMHDHLHLEADCVSANK
jgi:hypothetical protein